MGAHRGADPEDRAAFGEEALPRLREAVADLSWLLGRGYADRAALKLVGDRFQLSARQRAAIRRCAASDERVASRLSRRVPLDDLDGPLLVDGFNVLITVERAIGGGAVLLGREGACRDLAGVHGTWRRVAETDLALEAIALALGPSRAVHWLLDRPVSNSGSLARRIRALADTRGCAWTVEVVDRPDAELVVATSCIATSDSGILDRSGAWTSLAGEVIARAVPDAWVVDLGGGALRSPERG